MGFSVSSVWKLMGACAEYVLWIWLVGVRSMVLFYAKHLYLSLIGYVHYLVVHMRSIFNLYNWQVCPI